MQNAESRYNLVDNTFYLEGSPESSYGKLFRTFKRMEDFNREELNITVAKREEASIFNSF